VWGLFTLIGTALFTSGVLYSQLQAVIDKQKVVDLVYERQIKNIENVTMHDRQLQNHEVRIAQLERSERK
jgi:hypothetical protein